MITTGVSYNSQNRIESAIETSYFISIVSRYLNIQTIEFHSHVQQTSSIFDLFPTNTNPHKSIKMAHSVCFPNSMSILATYNIDYLTTKLNRLALVQMSGSEQGTLNFDHDLDLRIVRSLDDDVPEFDEHTLRSPDVCTQQIICDQARCIAGSLGAISFLGSDEYAEYKKKRELERRKEGKGRLPRSKKSRERLNGGC
jgi:hypothetical protein